MKSSIIVTYPDGRCVAEPVWVYYDPDLRLFEFLPTGENPLKGYLFGLVENVLVSVKGTGEVTDVDR